MNSFLYRNKRQASYHTPLAIRPTNKQNSKTASLKNKTKNKTQKSILVYHSKTTKHALKKSPEQITYLEIDSIFHGNAAYLKVRNLCRMFAIPRFNIYPLTFSQVGANSLSCHQHLNNISNQSTYGSKVSLLNIRYTSSANKLSLFWRRQNRSDY